uniref:ATP-dependent clp protease ATP-binding subunit clpx, putative n=1 Tax=Arundo donax TaxID=35708 RepID=A0A0A9CP88_ARUDO
MSRLMLRLSTFFVILSTSSMYTIPCCAACTLKSATVSNLYNIDSTSSPTYPAWVNVVASAITNGTFTKRANVFASKVLPEPVGPINRTLLFSSSTLSSSSASPSKPPKSAPDPLCKF